MYILVENIDITREMKECVADHRQFHTHYSRFHEELPYLYDI